MEGKTKAKIEEVGVVEDGIVKYWSFDCRNGAVGYEVLANGTPLVGGYTLKELENISNEKTIS